MDWVATGGGGGPKTITAGSDARCHRLQSAFAGQIENATGKVVGSAS